VVRGLRPRGAAISAVKPKRSEVAFAVNKDCGASFLFSPI